MTLEVNANDLLTILKLAKMSAQDEEHETIARVAKAALTAIDHALTAANLEPAPI